ncbi:delta-12-fatty acid desaturase [Meredithblackwellia eburnea MCA 4105]
MAARRRQLIEVDLQAPEDDIVDQSIPIFTPPPFTTKDLLDAIPKHCFERSALHSGSYLVADLLMIAGLVYLASHIDGAFGTHGTVLSGWEGVAAKWLAWGSYWFWNGLVMTGVWVIAHECGHQAFSTSKTINNTVGLIFHSALLVPYHNWRISHAKHHAGTGHLTRDEVFVPRTLEQRGGSRKGTGRKVKKNGIELDELLEDSPIYSLFMLTAQQLLGWPLYLTVNASGQKQFPKWTNHFNPGSIIFDARHREQVIISNIGILTVIGILHAIRLHFGWAAFIKFYFIPYLCVNHWLVMIVYLQHTDETSPHYSSAEWNFARGALTTIDRNLMGPIGPYLLHGICETHVVHHISSRLPHYHAWEATEAMKNFLGPHYMSTNENMFVSLWHVYRNCRYVEENEDVSFYRNCYGQVQRRVQPEKNVDSGVDVNEPEVELA